MKALFPILMAVITMIAIGCSGSDGDAPTDPADSTEPTIHDYISVENDTGYEITTDVFECAPGEYKRRSILMRRFDIVIQNPFAWINRYYEREYVWYDGGACDDFLENPGPVDETSYFGDAVGGRYFASFSAWKVSSDTTYTPVLEDFQISAYTITCSETDDAIVIGIDDPVFEN